MDSAPAFILYEHAVGYALFKVKEFEDVGQMIPEVESSATDVARFSSVVKLHSFSPFSNTENALENCNAISEGIMHDDLLTFLESNVPKSKKQKTLLGVTDGRLSGVVGEKLPFIQCAHTGVVPAISRGIRAHFEKLVSGITHQALGKAQLGLGHSYSRSKVKFNVNRVDNMIIQSIALLDQVDKDINTFGMRLREWYSYHFPELYKLVPEQSKYCRCVQVVKDRKAMPEDVKEQLQEIVMDEGLVEQIMEAVRTSMGMDISPIDLINIDRFATRVVSLADYRLALQGYLRERMSSCAPSLSALIGEQVGARLISHAGSLTNLAKYPASTVQILGAEKALFRALKTKGNTPKYGLLFHSTFIGRAGAKNKGRISRYLANKCSMAARIDSFSDVPVSTFGEHLKQQVEDRLKYFETGSLPRKNIDVMHEAGIEAVVATEKAVKKARKRAKKDRKSKGEVQPATEVMVTDEAAADTPQKSPKKKRKLSESVAQAEEAVESLVADESLLDTTGGEAGGSEKKKKKKKNKKAKADDDE